MNHYDHVIFFLFCKVLLRLVGLLMVLIFTGGWIFDFAGRLAGNWLSLVLTAYILELRFIHHIWNIWHSKYFASTWCLLITSILSNHLTVSRRSKILQESSIVSFAAVLVCELQRKKARLCASTTFLEAIAGVGKRNQAQETGKNTIIPWARQGSKDKRYSQTGKWEPHLVLYRSHAQSLPVAQILQTISSIWLCLTDLRLVNLIDPRPLTFHDGLDVDDFRNLKSS